MIKYADMVLAVSDKIATLSGGCPSSDSQLDGSEDQSSTLTNWQLEELNVVWQDIDRALSRLRTLVHQTSSASMADHCAHIADDQSGRGKSDSTDSEEELRTSGIVSRNRALFEHR